MVRKLLCRVTVTWGQENAVGQLNVLPSVDSQGVVGFGSSRGLLWETSEWWGSVQTVATFHLETREWWEAEQKAAIPYLLIRGRRQTEEQELTSNRVIIDGCK